MIFTEFAPGDLPERIRDMALGVMALFSINRECDTEHEHLSNALDQAIAEHRLGESQAGLGRSMNGAANDAKHDHVFPLPISERRGGPDLRRWTTAIVCAPADSIFWKHVDDLVRSMGDEEQVTVTGVGDPFMRRRWPPHAA